MKNGTTKIIYCDHSATTPIDPEVMQEVQRVMQEDWGNPSSVHGTGRMAKVTLESAREAIADTIHAARNEIIFTGGGTEADNFALRGIAGSLRHNGKHIITSTVEHHAILCTCQTLEDQGYEVTYLPVDSNGQVQPESVEAAIRDDTILISVMHANNEVGTINPIAEIGAIARENGIVFHTDAVQTYGKIPIDVTALPLDALSVSGHKIYGPKGVGFLYINNQIDINPLVTGGGQERHLRAGTENLPAIAGLAKAADKSMNIMNSEMKRLTEMQHHLESGILGAIPDAMIYGHPKERIPGLTCVGFDGISGESLVMNLDMRGIQVSSGSACSSGSITPSHVLQAMGCDPQQAASAIRISLGRENTMEQIPEIISAIQEEAERMRKISNGRSVREKVAAK